MLRGKRLPVREKAVCVQGSTPCVQVQYRPQLQASAGGPGACPPSDKGGAAHVLFPVGKGAVGTADLIRPSWF